MTTTVWQQLTMIMGRAGGQVLFKSWYWKGVETSKALLLSKWSQKLPRQREALTAQGDFGKITDAVRRNLWFSNVQMGNPRFMAEAPVFLFTSTTFCLTFRWA